MRPTSIVRAAGLVVFAVTISGCAVHVGKTASPAATPAAAPGVQLIMPAGGRANANFSPGILVGNTLYISGQLGTAARDSGIAGETHAAARGALAILQAAGMDLSNVVSVTAYLADVADYQTFNAAYREMFTTDPKPVRTTLVVKELVVQGAKVELTMVAVRRE